MHISTDNRLILTQTAELELAYRITTRVVTLGILGSDGVELAGEIQGILLDGWRGNAAEDGYAALDARLLPTVRLAAHRVLTQTEDIAEARFCRDLLALFAAA